MDTVSEPKHKKVATYCYQCINGPDILTVEVVDGVATRVEPNFAGKGYHPADGKVCVKPYGLVQKLYNPNRILKPMKRTNPKKGKDQDPGWVEISWDEALDTVAGKLNAIRAAGLLDDNGNPKFAFTTGGAGTPLMYMGAFPAFFVAWGPMDSSLGAGGTVKCYHSEHLYGELWHRAFTVLPDTPLCDYIVAFGNNIDASGGVTSVRRHADARARGLKRIQVEPHLSVTGASATEWVPIRPKTDSAFLFAMINVLLHEHKLEELDVPFLKQRSASPYLVAPNGYYLRDPANGKPLLWDLKTNRPVPHDTPGTDPALTGSFTVSGVEVGADDQTWAHDRVKVRTTFQHLVDHIKTHTPEWAEGVCDVPAKTIRRIANEFLAHARIGDTIVVSGRTLPLRPVAVMLGKAINNGWGGYECVWAQTLLQVLTGSLEVPGGLLGSTVLLSGMEHDRMGSVRPGPDGFMDFLFNPTDKENWVAQPEVRNGHRTLLPLVGNGIYSQPMGSSTLAWMRMQGRAADTWPKPKLPEVWLVYRCNPMISFDETSRIGETIAEFPFQASFVYTHDETSHFADVLLPDCTDLEGTQLIRLGGTHYFEQFWDHQGWVLRQPVVPPQGDARELTWIATELAKRTGLLEAFNSMINAGVCGLPLKTDGYDFSLEPSKPHTPEQVWDAVCRAASYDVTNGKSSEGLDYYKEHGFRLKPFPHIDWYLYPRIVDQGLRFELPYQERLYRVGRQLANRLHEHNIHWWDLQLTEYETLPEWKDLQKHWVDTYERNFKISIKDYPFWLLTARSMQYAWGGNVGIQLMREVALNVAGHSGILMNKKTGDQMGIREGDLVEVSSPVGKTQGRVFPRQGCRPDVLVMVGQFGHWKTPFAKDFKVPSLNDLLPMSMDMIDGTGSTVDSVRVQIRRVGG